MTLALDYAQAFEVEVRRRRTLGGRLRYAGVLAVWAVLFVVRPALAVEIWRERR